jgi:hypothetical protein
MNDVQRTIRVRDKVCKSDAIFTADFFGKSCARVEVLLESKCRSVECKRQRKVEENGTCDDTA